MTADELGNQHGFQCPKCGKGDDLRIAVAIWADLLPDGTCNSDSDTEWDDSSRAMCGCGWDGRVSEFLTVELEDA